MFRSVAALLGAAVAIVGTVIVGTLAAVALLAGPGGSVSASYLLANLAVSFGAALLGGWLVARLAPRRPLTHAAVLAAVMAILTLPSLGSPAPGQPSWYPVALLFIGVAGVACGAFLRVHGIRLQPGGGPAG
jgi:hypothetical protein